MSKRVQINIDCSPDLKALVKKVADKDHRSVSNWIKVRVVEVLIQQGYKNEVPKGEL